MDFVDVEQQVREIKARWEAAGRAAASEAEALEKVFADVDRLEEARTITQAIAEEIQRRAHERIARVVTRCLAAVFDDPYEFNIRFDKKRGRTEAVLEFSKEGKVFDDPLNEVGGGVLDVAGLALRLAVALVSRPPCRLTFVLDEPWSNVRGTENRRRTGRLLSVLAEEFGVQWIVNTDIADYRLGTVIELGG